VQPAKFMSIIVKICGLRTADALNAALEGGADMVGFVFFAASPRHVDLATAQRLSQLVRGHVRKVALTVDADDAELAGIIDALRPDLLQLHGHESPARLRAIKARFGLSVMKAIAVESRQDLEAIEPYAAVADRLLFDARAPRDATRPGGLGRPFDWRLLERVDVELPFMLSGGLDASNVAEALRITRAPGVDVSSGVERAPGDKDPHRIHAFIRAARASQTPAVAMSR
jgi:phosphoribosylanthranilate isomerase